MTRKLNGQRAVVVGAASGIGTRIAESLADAGALVAGCDLAAASWPETAHLHEKFAIDVADDASVESSLASAVSSLGGLEIVVSCAGLLGGVGPSVQVSLEDFEKVVRVNLFGAFSVTKHALGHLLPAGYGRIVHIASIAGKEGNPQMAAYSASKAGVIGLVKTVGREYATSGVTINAVAPASIDTPFIAGLSPERQDVQKGLIPMKRFGTTDEVSELVSYIVSPLASFTTGFVYDVSGGRAVY